MIDARRSSQLADSTGRVRHSGCPAKSKQEPGQSSHARPRSVWPGLALSGNMARTFLTGHFFVWLAPSCSLQLVATCNPLLSFTSSRTSPSLRSPRSSLCQLLSVCLVHTHFLQAVQGRPTCMHQHLVHRHACSSTTYVQPDRPRDKRGQALCDKVQRASSPTPSLEKARSLVRTKKEC